MKMIGDEGGRATRVVQGIALGAAGYAVLRTIRGTPDEIDGEVVFITGGSRGLGFLLAREFARHGCRIAICARDQLELDTAATRLRAAGATVLALTCDVADRHQVDRAVERVTEHYGRIDILVNNAGVIQVGPVEAMTFEDFEKAMDIIYWGSIHTCAAVLPQMIERGHGRVVNVTSINGRVAFPHLLPYTGAKFALNGFSEGLRAEVKRHGISVTTVVPGLMRTGSPANAFFKGDAAKEFTWFTLATASPLTSMSAARAARRIVLAARRGEARVTLSWQAKLLRLMNDLFPTPTSGAMALTARMLPRGSSVAEHRGMHLSSPLAPSPVTALINRAARRNNEFGGAPRPSRKHARKAGLSRPDHGDWAR